MLKGLEVVDERPVTATVELCPGVTELGVNVQVAPEMLGHESVMLLVKPLVLGADAETVNVAEVAPTVIVDELGLAASEKTATPVPLRLTLCGLPDALSVTPRIPLFVAPVPVGMKVIVNTQFACGLRVAPQVLVWLKSPDMAIELMLRTALPLLVSVNA